MIGVIVLRNYLENIDVEQLKSLANEQKSLSYAELCKAIGMEPVTSNSKKAQLGQLSQICRYEKKRTHYRIIEYYIDPVIIDDGKQKYQPYLETIIMGSLNKGQSRIETAGTLREWLGLCNRNFKLLGNRINCTKIVLGSNYDQKALRNMYTKSAQFFSQTIENCFRSLKKHNRITVENGYRLFDIRNKIKIAENVFSGNPRHSKVVEIERSVLESLKTEGKIHPAKNGYIVARGEQEKYWKECNKLVCQELNIIGYCPARKITMCVDRRRGDIDGARKVLNEKVSEELLKAISKENFSAKFIYDFIQTAETALPDYLKIIEDADEDYMVVDDSLMADFQEIILK